MLDSLFIFVLNMSLIASYVILFILLARLLLKNTPKIFSYALWGIVLFKLICPFSFESDIGLLPSNTKPIPQDIVYQTTPQIDTGINVIDNSVNAILPPVLNPDSSINPIQIWISIGRDIWIIGIVNMLIYSILQFVKLKKQLIGSTPLRNNIYLTDHISSPFVMGIFKTKIYLPSSLSESEKDYIILHENHHIKRFDHVTRILGFIALSIHWFNPIVWIAFVLSGKDMEMSCDEAIMKKMDNDIRAEYSRSLLRFATGRKLIIATPLAFGEGDTKGRVKNVMKYKKPMVWVVIVALVVVACITVGFMSNLKQNNLDLSLLNPQNVGNLVFQSETDFPVIHEDGEQYTITPKDFSLYLSDTEWEQKNEEQLKLAASFEVDIDGRKMRFYESELDLIMIYDEFDYRYYTANNAYDKFLKLLIPPTCDGNTANTPQNIDPLDMAVSKAILDKASSNITMYDFTCESHYILATEASSLTDNSSEIETLTVYAMVLVQHFNIRDGVFTEEGGSHIPTAITFDVSDNSEYIINEYWEPRGGLYHASDIKEKFPTDAVDLALDTQIHITAQIQNCYAQVIEYENINTEKMITSLIDEIANMVDDPSNWRLVGAKRDLTYFGDYMLNYAYRRFLEGNQVDEKGKIMEQACRSILNQHNEDIDLIANTGQEWFDSYYKSLKDFKEDEGLEFVKNNMQKGYTLLMMDTPF